MHLKPSLIYALGIYSVYDSTYLLDHHLKSTSYFDEREAPGACQLWALGSEMDRSIENALKGNVGAATGGATKGASGSRVDRAARPAREARGEWRD